MRNCWSFSEGFIVRDRMNSTSSLVYIMIISLTQRKYFSNSHQQALPAARAVRPSPRTRHAHWHTCTHRTHSQSSHLAVYLLYLRITCRYSHETLWRLLQNNAALKYNISRLLTKRRTSNYNIYIGDKMGISTSYKSGFHAGCLHAIIYIRKNSY